MLPIIAQGDGFSDDGEGVGPVWDGSRIESEASRFTRHLPLRYDQVMHMDLNVTSRQAVLALALLGVTVMAPAPAEAQITMAQAQVAVDAAEAEARANDWNLTIFVADADGVPVYLRRMDGAPPRTTEIVRMKAHVVITTGGTSGAYGQALAAGTVDTIPGGIHYEGGLPILMNGELIGAMAASGARGSEDAQAVRAGLAAIGATSGN
jgi:glc operon protein GlcG